MADLEGIHPAAVLHAAMRVRGRPLARPWVTYAALHEYAQGLIWDGLAPATVNRRLSMVSVALREGHRLGMCPAPPLFPHMKEPPGRDRYLTNAEERYLLNECAAMAADQVPSKRAEWDYMAALIVVLLDTGMRLSEALTTRAADIQGDMLHIGDHRTKTQRGRIIPLTPRALVALSAMVAADVHLECASVNWAGHRFMQLRKRLRMVDGVCLHVLRHTCAARLLSAGVGIYTVSKWLGHSSVKVTERYAKLQTGMLTGAREALVRQLDGK